MPTDRRPGGDRALARKLVSPSPAGRSAPASVLSTRLRTSASDPVVEGAGFAGRRGGGRGRGRAGRDRGGLPERQGRARGEHAPDAGRGREDMKSTHVVPHYTSHFSAIAGLGRTDAQAEEITVTIP